MAGTRQDAASALLMKPEVQNRDATLRALQSLIDTAPSLRGCLPQLMELRQAVEQQGRAGLEALSPLVRHLLIEKLRALPTGTSGTEIEALIQSLAAVERRRRPRTGDHRNLVSTPEMYAAETTFDEFQKATRK